MRVRLDYPCRCGQTHWVCCDSKFADFPTAQCQSGTPRNVLVGIMPIAKNDQSLYPFIITVYNHKSRLMVDSLFLCSVMDIDESCVPNIALVLFQLPSCAARTHP